MLTRIHVQVYVSIYKHIYNMTHVIFMVQRIIKQTSM